MTERAPQTKTTTNAQPAAIQSVAPRSYLRRKCADASGASGSFACNGKRESELWRAASDSTASASVTGIVRDVLGSPGQPLDSVTRSFMEPKFGRDFSSVRVHTDARASDSARSVAARAYTVGRDIVFGDGRYSPDTREGKSLLAHELTHVAQNNGAPWSTSEPLSIGPQGDRLEAEADARADAIASGDLRATAGSAITANSESGRMSRATFQVGANNVEVNFDSLGMMPAKDYEKEIERRFTSWTGARASTIHSSIKTLSAIEKEFVLFGIDLLQDNPLAGLDKIQAVKRIIARAPKANTRPIGSRGNEFAEEILAVSGWSEKALTSGLTAPTGSSLSKVQGLLGVTTSGGSAPSESCPSPRKPEDQLKKTDFETELPKRLVKYLGKVAIAKTPVAQAMPPLLKAADEVQNQARKFYSPYADRSTGTGNTMLQRWQYSSHTVSSQSAQATPKPEVRTAYIASRSNKVGDLGLFAEVKYDWRCAADKKVLADLVTQMEKDSTIQPMVDKILREKSYTAQDADPKFVVLDPQYDSSKTTECDGRWKTVKTMCHEMMHVMVHPNFHNAEKNRQLLTEGFPEVLGHYLYKDVRKQAGSDAKLKSVMEDGVSTSCATIPDSTIEYAPGGPKAEKIRTEVGDDNFRAAFFLGQVSLVGIQPKRLDDRNGNDPREKEADHAAQAVVDAKPLPASITPVPFSLESNYLTNESGAPLEANLQREMESSFGRDFSGVRVHTDSGSAASAASLGSLAYTVGNDIVFGAGRYSPETRAGRRLLAHELTHVVQQSASAKATEGLIAQTPALHDGLIQRSEKDPDEVAATANEDLAIQTRAKQALASGKPAFAVHEVMWRLIKSHGLDTHFELSGSRYDQAQKGVVVDLKGKGPRTMGTIVGGDDVLQRVANGQAAQVAKEIEAQIGKVGTARGTIDYVFIMGADAPKTSNPFYAEAKKFFQAENPGATMVENVRDLEGINKKINLEDKPVANLFIVSHAHPDGTLQFSIDPSDKTPGQMQYSELKKANDAQSVTKPKPDLVGFWTNVMIRGCNLGRNQEMLQETKKAFGGDARVIAPTHEQGYSGGKESMGGAFYEEPGISKLSDKEAFARIKAKPEYSFITDWDAMRSKLKRFNQSIPEIVYEGKFPAKGKEIELLQSEQGAKVAANYTVGPSTIDGTQTVFNYVSRDSTKWGDIEIRQETPPDDKAAIALARETVARPDAYAYNIRRTRSGLMLSVIVDIQRTEWELYHAEMKKKGKGFNPSPESSESKTWFGDTDN